MVYDGPEPYHVRSADIQKHEQWIKLLDRVSRTKNGTVIFLVRTNGLGTYWQCRRAAYDNYCRNGKLPVSGMGHLDLSICTDPQQR